MKTSGAPQRVVVANWKMNPRTLAAAKVLFLESKAEASRRTRVQTIIAVPAVYLGALSPLMKTSRSCKLGAQDVFWEQGGTYTGEIAPAMLMSVGVSHVIIGHSERRALGETDVMVARKVAAAIKEGLTAVLCIGESTRDSGGGYLSVVEQQLRSACVGVPKSKLTSLIVAYEPIWAISTGDGKGQTATPGDVYEMTIFIRKVLTTLYTRPSAERVCILYGGSVNEENASILVREAMINGFLVGGASLKARTFAPILSAANEVSS